MVTDLKVTATYLRHYRVARLASCWRSRVLREGIAREHRPHDARQDILLEVSRLNGDNIVGNHASCVHIFSIIRYRFFI